MYTKKRAQKAMFKLQMKVALSMLPASTPLFVASHASVIEYVTDKTGISKVAFAVSVLTVSLALVILSAVFAYRRFSPICFMCKSRLEPLGKIIESGKCSHCNGQVIDLSK